MSVINRTYSFSWSGRLTGGALRALRNVAERIATWEERASSRHRLGQIDDWMLKDVGLTRADVAREMGKPFWRS